MQFTLLTIFPHIFDSYLNESILKRAQNQNLIKIKTLDIRKFSKDKHKSVDDTPYGGGPGMIMKIEPIFRALKAMRSKSNNHKQRVILLAPQGKMFNQKTAQRLTCYDELIFVCGRYEGIDARVEKFVDEKISIGNYVLSGGELPALVILESVARLLPEVLGNEESLVQESFALNTTVETQSSFAKASAFAPAGAMADKSDGKNFVSLQQELEYPQYTRPEIFSPDNGKTKWRVPKILLSGDHKKIEQWRKKKMKVYD